MSKSFSSRCVCCNAFIEYSYLSDPDLCSACSIIVRRAIKEDNYIRPEYVHQEAHDGVTPMRRSGIE